MQVSEDHGEIKVTSFELEEEFSTALLAGECYVNKISKERLYVERGQIVIKATNGIWKYTIEKFAMDGRTVVGKLESYHR